MNRYEIDVQLSVALPGEIEEAAAVQRVQQAAAATLEQERVAAEAALTVVLTGDEEIHSLNREYRQVDKTTDVLSFPSDHGVPGMESYLGDVLISVPVTWQQAASAGHHPLDELALLTVHGVLHLLDYDHEEPEEKRQMWERQNAVLDGLGLAVRPPELDNEA